MFGVYGFGSVDCCVGVFDVGGLLGFFIGIYVIYSCQVEEMINFVFQGFYGFVVNIKIFIGEVVNYSFDLRFVGVLVFF